MTNSDSLRRRLLAASMGISGSASAGFVGMAVEADSALPLGGGQIPPDTTSLFLPEFPLLVQAIVTPIGSTADGMVVQSVGPVWRGLLRLLAKDPQAIQQLNPRQLEELVAASYEEEGFDHVVLTPRSGDHGRDVIATRRDMYTVRIVDQVKHFAPHHKVTADDVRSLAFVALADERATHGFVTTTSSFAPGIERDPFLSKYLRSRLELVDGVQLLKRLNGYVK